jgi:uncharacterized repeat protein (TIGR01451 family)
MKELLPAWILALMLAGAAPAWAAPGVVSLTTPVLPANAARTPINGLSVSSGTPTRYNITSLPGGGTLYVNNVAVTAARSLTPTEATQLAFQPSGTAGNYSFTFTATDGTGTSAAVTYALSVGLATCGQASGLNFSTRAANENWQAQSATVGSVVTTSSNYVAGDGANRFQIENLQAGSQSAALTWFADYTTRTGSTSQVTFTFSRPVSGFSIVVQDIDAASATLGTATFIDQVQFDGYSSGSNTPITLAASNVKLGTTNAFSGNNCVTGTNLSAATPANNVIVTFPQAITRLTLTYRNTQTAATDPAQQAIGIPSFGWCAEADIATTLAGPTRAQAGSQVTYSLTTTNTGPDQPTSLTPTLQLPTGLAGVTVSNSGTYNSSTGLVTFPAIANLPLNTAVPNSVTFTMPATNAVQGTAAYQSAILDNVATNNTATLATTQNRAPVASDVTNSPAILSSTTTPTNIAPLNASDPDATTGNTTIASYTIVTLPTAAQGTLYVNGSAATVGQVIAVPTTATAGNPGYQLSFVPNGTFSGSATFTYRATDDVGSASNTANYAVPVTPGADLVTTVGGQPVGVEGQSKSYSVTTTNNSTTTASTNVVPTLTLSSKPAFSSVSVTNGSYDATTGIITFNATPSLASSASVVNTFALVVPLTPSSFTVTAASTSGTADPTPANNNGTAAPAILTVAVSPIGPAGVASTCATPGRDGSPTITTSPNTYYPATNAQTVATGATSLSLDAAVGATPIAAGDLLLVIQMQGADIESSNTDAYGDGVAGGLATGSLTNANFLAGQYEYVVAATALPLGGGALTLTTGLKKSYQNANATGTTGQRRFQVVRIPQYQNLTISGTVAPVAWNGSVGGILALDVTGQLAFASGAKIDASGLGFRGGAGQRLLGASSGYTGTDYRAAAAAPGTTIGAHAMKGEGTVGTPRYVNSGTALLDTGFDGYPGGSAGRGAPGNAGGGGDTSSPLDNTQNSGGGGGANGARGGRGGNAWQSNAVVGGELGSPFSVPSTSRLILGGGGGAGVTNDGTGTGPTLGYASSGAAGGGIVLVRTGSVAGVGTILANGASANNTVQNDGSGGGGAGGAILVTANNTASLSSLTLAANGGNGGTNTGTNINGSEVHGPGGGGGGGIVLTNAAPSSASVVGGANGTTHTGVAFGATAGGTGIANRQVSNSIAASTSGVNCSTDVLTLISAPSAATAGQTANLSVSFTNNGGVAATAVTRTVTLVSGDVLNPVTGVVAPGSSSISLPDPSTGTVTITYPGVSPLAAGSTNSFGISYVAPGTTSVVANSAITTSTAEPVTTNNTSSATTAINGFADVVTALFGLNSSITGQPTATYAVVFANNGPAAATVTARNVQLPTGATLTMDQNNAIVAQGGSFSAGVISFGPATLNSRQGQPFTFSYTAPLSGGPNNIVSTITTSSQQDAGNGPGAAPDVFSFALTNNPASDLATNGVTVSSPTVQPGQPASFVVKYTNYGPSLATDALRFAQLTPGLTGVVVTDYNGTVLSGAYNATTGIVTLPNVTVASGGTAYATIAFTAPAIGPVSVSGSMSGGTGSISSGIYGNNQATASIDVTPVADVAIVINGPTSATIGNLVTFIMSTRNNGPSPAAGVVQTVQLPTGLAGVFATNGGIYDAGTGKVTFPTLAVLGSGLLTNNKVSFAMPATFTASAAVTTTTTETSSTANNSAPAATTTATAATTDQANVYTTLTISEKNVVPNAPVTCTLEATNAGPATALNVVQQLALRPGLTIPPANISNGGTYDATTGVVTFPALASLASGATVANTVLLAAPATGPISPTASVMATTSDPVPGDNRVVRYVDVFTTADVATTLVGPSIAAATQAATTFFVNMLNNGPVPARAVVQTVAIPAGLAPADVVVSNGGTYRPATGLITWPEVDALAVGEGRSYTYSYVAPAYASTDAANPRTVVSVATVTSATSDDVKANNTAAVATLIRWNSDVAIAVAGPTTAVVGNSITFAVAITNNGPAPAPSVTPTVRITTGLTNVVASGGGTYDATTGLVTFPTLTNLAVGATGAVTNTITLTVPDRPLIGVSAAANVPTSTNDTNLTNNAATLTLPVTPPTTTQVDVQTTIAANVSTQQAGQPVVLTVTATNSSANGNTTAVSLRQRVNLPAGLSGVTAADVSSGTAVSVPGAYDAASGTVTFPTATNVAAGATRTYTITVSSYSNDPLVATATVNSNLSDPLPANNIQAVSVNIIPVADVATRLSGPAALLPGSLAAYEVVSRNNGPSPASAVTQTVQLPTGLGDVTVSGGGTYDAASGRVTFPTIAKQAVGLAGQVTNTIAFTFPTTAITVSGTVSTGTTQAADSLANNTASLTTALANQVPLANNFANRLQSPEGNTATALTLSALGSFDADGSVASFTIKTLPASAAGVLLLRGVPVVQNQPISLAEAASLAFDPLAPFVGTASFTYTATDNQGAVSIPATYNIPVGQDNTSVYTPTPVKGGTSPYQNGDVLANVFDANGGAYNSAAAVTDNGVRSAISTDNSLPAGTQLDPTTGQITVADRTLLVTGTYPVNITTIDANGGVTTQTVPLQIGAYPLPVDLTRFDAQATGLDGELNWATAQERRNAGFQIERSFDGTTFAPLTFVAGAGTSVQSHSYSFLDAGVGQQHRTVYYRLQQRDLDGKTSYSPVRVVAFGSPALALNVGLYPNPATDQTTLDLTTLPAGTYQVRVLDLAGRLLQSHTLTGGLTHRLTVGELPSGSYLVLVSGEAMKITRRLTKE